MTCVPNRQAQQLRSADDRDRRKLPRIHFNYYLRHCFGLSKEAKERGAVAVGVWNLVGWAGRLNACHLEAPRRGLIRVGGLVDWSRLWCRIVDGPRGGVAQKTWERTGQPRLGIEYRIGPLSRERRGPRFLSSPLFFTPSMFRQTDSRVAVCAHVDGLLVGVRRLEWRGGEMTIYG